MAAKERWAKDFMHDALVDGTMLRVLTAIDVHTREFVGLVGARSFTDAEVGEGLRLAGQERGALPRRMLSDNGTEFRSKSLNAWPYWNGLEWDVSRPNKATDNAYIEAFKSLVR